MNEGVDLRNRVAIVTGASGGLGRAICQGLHAAGARLALWDRDLAPLERLSDAWCKEAYKIAVDVTDESAVAAAAKATHALCNRVDILVNNAGIYGRSEIIERYDAALWRRVLEVNLLGTFLCCKAAAPLMREGGYGRIVNIASVAGRQAVPGNGAYGASKAAVIWLTNLLGLELAGSNVLANCVTPATVDTGDVGMASEVGPQLLEAMKQRIPLGRLAAGAEVAHLVAWLSSPLCSFSTGAVFDISGGRYTL